MKKDLAEVKAYAKAMADSNRARDAYVDKEQDKFFHQLNRQWVDINGLKDRMEHLESRVRALELENESLLACLDSMVVLGSAILPPSRIPERNPRTLYVVCTYLSFISNRFPPRFQTYLSRTVHHLISPSSLPFTC